MNGAASVSNYSDAQAPPSSCVSSCSCRARFSNPAKLSNRLPFQVNKAAAKAHARSFAGEETAAAGRDRRKTFQWNAVAPGRAVPRRPRARDRRSSRRTKHVVFRRRCGRGLENNRWRSKLGRRLFDKEDISSIGAIAVAPSDHNVDLCRNRAKRRFAATPLTGPAFTNRSTPARPGKMSD